MPISEAVAQEAAAERQRRGEAGAEHEHLGGVARAEARRDPVVPGIERQMGDEDDEHREAAEEVQPRVARQRLAHVPPHRSMLAARPCLLPSRGAIRLAAVIVPRPLTIPRPVWSQPKRSRKWAGCVTASSRPVILLAARWRAEGDGWSRRARDARQRCGPRPPDARNSGPTRPGHCSGAAPAGRRRSVARLAHSASASRRPLDRSCAGMAADRRPRRPAARSRLAPTAAAELVDLHLAHALGGDATKAMWWPCSARASTVSSPPETGTRATSTASRA